MAELRARFDWSTLRIFQLNTPGQNHGILLGTKGWAVVFDIICRRYFGDICRMPSLCNDNRLGERKPMTAIGVFAFS
jgi:hypothetical protein